MVIDKKPERNKSMVELVSQQKSQKSIYCWIGEVVMMLSKSQTSTL